MEEKEEYIYAGIPRFMGGKYINEDEIKNYDVTNSSSFTNQCKNVKCIVIRQFGTNKHCGGGSTFGSTNIVRILVPRKDYESLLNETGWSYYATKLRVLEDYTDDGTINGVVNEGMIE